MAFKHARFRRGGITDGSKRIAPAIGIHTNKISREETIRENFMAHSIGQLIGNFMRVMREVIPLPLKA
jgi:hypothetical protein